MESYNKKRLRISGVLAGLSFTVGLGGYLFTHNQLFWNFIFITMGINFIVFSHDLAMKEVVKHKFNYKVARGWFLLGGVLFILAAIQSWW